MRKSGILMHLTSLPDPYGIGSMGKCAYDFIDFLRSAGQSCWQILPLSPTGYGDSPYQSLSTFAGNPYLIDLELLARDGLLTREELSDLERPEAQGRVDFGTLYQSRPAILRRAFSRFRPDADFRHFCSENQDWLPDYSLFMAVKERQGGMEWLSWPRGIRTRAPEAMAELRTLLDTDIQFHAFLQYTFFRQWDALHRYAAQQGIRIIGDVPIYVPLDSADVWSAPEEFQLSADLQPTAVAGCPPDAFTADGQLWGNPLYDWAYMRQNGYRWWLRRLRAASKLYDVVRLDHFRGFESYWSVPAEAQTAAQGHWEPGPGLDLIRAIQTALPDLRCIAEDLGYITPQVRALQEASGYPGMKVMEFAFDSRENGDYLPHLYPTNSVCYSGTHDNPPLGQWLKEAAPEDLAAARAYLGLNPQEGEIPGLIRGCMSSISSLCMIQMQDYLGLEEDARMNTPGMLSCQNWSWRAAPGCFTPQLARQIREITLRYGRL